MKRKDALVAIRTAGYHADQRTAMRLYVENRISRAAFEAEFRRGKDMRAAGVPCVCRDCSRR